MKKFIFTVSIIAVFLSCQICSAENWVLFATTSINLDYYYEKDSITYTNENTFLVWYKNIPRENAEYKLWLVSIELREVDCSRRRYKILKGQWIYEDKPMEEKKESAWEYFDPSGLDTAYYQTVCEKNK